ncbi:MAG: hypothetical protein ABIH46_08405 [Chloroflexota bacterium]
MTDPSLAGGPDPVIPVLTDDAVALPDGAQEPTNVDQLPVWAQDHIKALRKENAGHRHKTKEAEAATSAAEEAKLKEQKEFQALAERYAQERDAALIQAVELQTRLTRQVIATEFSLPAEIAARLQGDDEEAMRADAKVLQGILKVPATGIPASPSPDGTPPKLSDEEKRKRAWSPRSL